MFLPDPKSFSSSSSFSSHLSSMLRFPNVLPNSKNPKLSSSEARLFSSEAQLQLGESKMEFLDVTATTASQCSFNLRFPEAFVFFSNNSLGDVASLFIKNWGFRVSQEHEAETMQSLQKHHFTSSSPLLIKACNTVALAEIGIRVHKKLGILVFFFPEFDLLRCVSGVLLILLFHGWTEIEDEEDTMVLVLSLLMLLCSSDLGKKNKGAEEEDTKEAEEAHTMILALLMMMLFFLLMFFCFCDCSVAIVVVQNTGKMRSIGC